MVNIPFEIFDYEIYGYAALAIAAVVLSVVTIRRKAALSHWVADNALNADADEAMPLPALSVIVLTSGCDAELLASNIPLMMSQNYPDFEIIVVNADASESVDDAMILLQVEYPQLRSTFIPDSTANVSKRKLGITLGVKAAKNDIVVVTSAKCRPQSDLWLRCIGRHFDDYTDVVLGYSHNDHNNDRGLGHRYRTFDNCDDASRYLAAAIHGNTYRACANNVAYKRSAFFAVKGFSSSLNLKYGDDDIFISEIADGDNVAVELSPESILVEHNDSFAYTSKLNKERHFFTQKFLRSRIPGIRLLTNVAYYLYLLLAAAGVAYPAMLYLNGDGEWLKPTVLASVAAAIYLTETLIFIFAKRRTATVLQSPRHFFCLPLFRFAKPFINGLLNWHSQQGDNYTWE